MKGELMNSKIIYEKKYPPLEIPSSEEIKALNATETEKTERLTFEQIMEKIYKDMIYVLVPERAAKAKAFIRQAIAVSELYEMDVKIEHHLSHISATYYFDSGGGMKHLLDVAKMADDVAFFRPKEGHDIIMSLDFFTHLEYRNGRQVRP